MSYTDLTVRVHKTGQINEYYDEYSVRLNPDEYLSIVREIDKVRMDTILLFAKIKDIPTQYEQLEIIERDDEDKTKLREIIDAESNSLHIREYPLKSLNEQFKLEYGYTITENNGPSKATNNAFKIKLEGCEIKKMNNIEDNPGSFTKYEKASLEFKLEPTLDFIQRVEDAVNSGLEKIEEITEKYGSVISEKVILGEIVHFNNSSINSCEFLVGGTMFDSNFREESLNDLRNWRCIKLIKPISIFRLLPNKLFSKVLKLLESVGKRKVIYANTVDYDVEFNFGKGFIGIPDEISTILEKDETKCKVFATVINKNRRGTFNCQIYRLNNKPRLIIHCIKKRNKRRKYRLKIRWMVIGYDISFGLNSPNFDVKLIEKEFSGRRDYTCKDFINLDSYNSSDLYFGMPELSILDYSNTSLNIGHTFFDDPADKKFGICIFSYCQNKENYATLPANFTFYILVVTINNRSNDYGMSDFETSNVFNSTLRRFNSTLEQEPKFLSLYTTGQNRCALTFLKQKASEIKMKHIKCTVCVNNNEVSNCRTILHGFENSKYAFFQVNQDNNWLLKIFETI